MRFKNASDITKYYQKLVNEGRADELKASISGAVAGATISLVSEKELKEAADALKGFLLSHIKRYFDSYSPVIYQRSGEFLNSIMVEITKDSGKLRARVYFDSSKTIRDSFFDGGAQGDTVLLLDRGWQVQKDVWFKDIEHFGYFDGWPGSVI